MIIKQRDINYIEYICQRLPELLNDINEEIEKNNYYVFSSENRAEFERLRVELNKKLMEIKRVIY